MQDELHANFTKKFITDNGFIEQSELDAAIAGNSDEAELIVRTIHALNPEPGAWLIDEHNKRIRILSARVVNNQLIPDRVIPEGRKEMDWPSYLRGFQK